jgi:hypothetical protein
MSEVSPGFIQYLPSRATAWMLPHGLSNGASPSCRRREPLPDGQIGIFDLAP